MAESSFVKSITADILSTICIKGVISIDMIGKRPIANNSYHCVKDPVDVLFVVAHNGVLVDPGEEVL